MKSDYRIRAERFIAEIYPYICEFPTSRMYYRKAIARFNHEHHNRRVECSNGAVRIALITSDYVVKFDYEPEEAHEYGGCEDEVNFYQFATEMGFQHLFAEVTPFVYKGHMFCIMPRVNGIERYEGRYAEEFMKQYRLWVASCCSPSHLLSAFMWQLFCSIKYGSISIH